MIRHPIDSTGTHALQRIAVRDWAPIEASPACAGA